ncbi:MAG: FAD-binding domain-containing protein [Pseudomonadota bacterium]
MNVQSPPAFVPTRAAAEAALEAFAPRMGRRYSGGRNYDRGAGRHRDVSQLSPYIRRRMVLEEDVIAAALQHHGLDGAEKFIKEVAWRGYFKGWLERRPQVWEGYKEGLHNARFALEKDRSLRAQYEAAVSGATGLAYFDAWANELIETGYMHNHARMWFASIWIFTLHLPWQLGADFFYRHLLDGDAASNTLSWRWVAGLHTRGKPYQAQAWNIEKYTEARFSPSPAELEEVVDGLQDQEPEGLPPVQPLRDFTAADPSLKSAVLLTDDDCRLGDLLEGPAPVAVATLAASHLRSAEPVSQQVVAFEEAALQDAAQAFGPHTELTARDPADVIAWAQEAGAEQIITSYTPEGPLRDWIVDAEPAFAAAGLRLAEARRPWDGLIWPHATAGFFKVKKKIPEILHRAGVM